MVINIIYVHRHNLFTRILSLVCSDYLDLFMVSVINTVHVPLNSPVIITVVIIHAGSSWRMGRVISGNCDCASVWLYPRKKMLELSTRNSVDSAWQALGMHWTRGQKVKVNGHTVIRCAAGMVCMSIGLLRFRINCIWCVETLFCGNCLIDVREHMSAMDLASRHWLGSFFSHSKCSKLHADFWLDKAL